MDIWQALVLGIVQGLAEFLPISSSGHLLLLQAAFDWNIPHSQIQSFDVALHVGTLIALVAFFRHDLWTILAAWVRSLPVALRGRLGMAPHEAKLGWWIILGTIPAVAFYLAFEDAIRWFERAPIAICLMLIGFTGVFWLAESVGKQARGMGDVRLRDALLIGIGQAMALFPGMSRSGATISTGLLLGLDRATAARFSFVLSAPVVLAATVKEAPAIMHLGSSAGGLGEALIVGFLASLLSGLVAIRVLLRFVNAHSLTWFAVWRVPVGLAFLAYFMNGC